MPDLNDPALDPRNYQNQSGITGTMVRIGELYRKHGFTILDLQNPDKIRASDPNKLRALQNDLNAAGFGDQGRMLDPYITQSDEGYREKEASEDAAGLKSEADFSQRVQEEAAKRTDANLQQSLDRIYGQAETTGAEKIRRAFIPQRQRLISEEAALGRLRSPVSIPSIARADEAESNAVNDFLGSIAGQRASGQLDFSKTIEGILAGERRAGEQAQQFGQDLTLRRQTLSQQLSEAQRDRELQRELSSLQNDALNPESSGLDTALGIIGGLGSAAGGTASISKAGGLRKIFKGFY